MSKKLPTRSENYSEWYNELVKRAGLAENSEVRGCMIIKPYGFAIWEKIQATLDSYFKESGHQNAYFPLFIPKSFLSKEASHVEGFAKECAVVTHYRLKVDENKKVIVDPEAKLEEELIIRPTSETIIWNTYKNWIQSYRDLPLLINQWCNVVRWEMRTRLFLRTAEFLWQEGHTAHATQKEAEIEAEQMIDIYQKVVENYLAISVLKGKKTENERFAGAVETYCIEAMMQDKKALQAGTSHFLGQNFAKAFEVKFQTKEGNLEYVWGTSWGVSTRLMGALIMAHSDDKGLVLPPKLAPIQVVIIPIFKTSEQLSEILEYLSPLVQQLKDDKISLKIDDSDKETPGFKFSEYELKGVPIRLALGKRDQENNTIEVVRRDTNTKVSVHFNEAYSLIKNLLEEIQNNLFQTTLNFRREHTFSVTTWEEFIKKIELGFVEAFWDGSSETEEKIKELTKATIRCIPSEFENTNWKGKCVYSQKETRIKVVFSKAY